MPKILVVEDESDLSLAIRDWLEEDYHVVEIAGSGVEAMDKLENRNYDLVILDWMLPGMDGLEVCRTYRAKGGLTPILMLTAKKSLEAKEAGLDGGADDYLTKPFQLRELSARVRALLRRPVSAPHTIFTVGDLVLDRNACKVSKSNVEVHLLPKEFMMLELLMRNCNQVLSVDFLLDQVWGEGNDVTPDTVRSYIKTLRKKLDTTGSASIIHTVHGSGYKIEG